MNGRGGLTLVIDLSAARVDCLEKLVDFVIAHFFSEIRQDCVRLAFSCNHHV